MFDDPLKRVGISRANSGAYAGGWIDHPGGGELISYNPATEESLASMMTAAQGDYERVVKSAELYHVTRELALYVPLVAPMRRNLGLPR